MRNTNSLFVPIRVAALLALSTMVSGCWSDSETWNQKLKVTIETPEGVVSGEAVSRLKMTNLARAEEAMTGRVRRGSLEAGEATVVALPNGRYLFALLNPYNNSDSTLYIPFYTFLQNFPAAYPDHVEAARKFKRLKGPRDIPVDRYPLLVTFTDIKDPKSVRKVEPRDLAASFGAGYSLKSLTLEITDEPVTEGKVEALLLWLRTLQGALVPTRAFKPATEYKPEEGLGREHFILGQ